MTTANRLFLCAALSCALALGACDGDVTPPSSNADAEAALDAGQWRAAQGHLARIFSSGKADEATQAIKLDLMLEMGDGYGAMAAIEALPESALGPDERRVANAHALILQGNPRAAAALYDGMEPEAFGEQDYRMTVWLLREMGEEEAFEAGLDSGLEAYPDSADLNAMAARALIEGDAPEEAARFVTRALASEPAHYEALLAKGELEIGAGELEAALATYRKAADAWPDRALPLANIAGLHLDLGQVEAAGETLKGAVAAHPDEPFLQWQLARHALATDDLDTARTALEITRRAFGDRDAFTLLSARAEERFGNTALALSEYQRYLDSVGENAAVEARIAALEAGG
jgi:predicted Zn-dependent protease